MMIEKIKTFGKFLYQPLLVAKMEKNVPKAMGLAVGAIFAKQSYDIFTSESNRNEAKQKILKNGIILSSVLLSALSAPKIASKITKRPQSDSLNKIIEQNKENIDKFIKNNSCDELMNKAKSKILNFNEIEKLQENLSRDKEGRKLFEKLIPSPKNISAKDIFSEIGYLSVYGAVPVVGSVGGGILADKLTKENSKEKTIDKVNEGLYQYLANIFMCNIGAGVALGILEKMNIKSKMARVLGMTLGIILTGVLGGSKIANCVSGKIINKKVLKNDNYCERKPELLDLGLHVDDIATVSLLSGLKWIEPALPILYGISGYKAGIGYRNNNGNSYTNCHY